ncbi:MULTISPECIES: hypothetical protein [Olivibacter]|uniref:Uncharacterized protein n=2 Tax=Sphingobacteriaceae TaxID=84566 RepID=F4C9A7_SPHS2|nr:hypothetical protein [Pseudosphingobacterium sp.]
MDRIVLEVDSSLAKVWRNTTPSLKAKYEKKIASILKEMKEVEFERLLNKAGKVAAKNGLTEDELNNLLNEED